MKNHPLYSYYLQYLNDRLLSDKISRGSYSLLLISYNYFSEFVNKLENDEKFLKIFTNRNSNSSDRNR